jgi:DNA-binding LacI/PurR family transcriptional regulator/signal transduction histidine kinase/ActR/RegA family two-component response regulator
LSAGAAPEVTAAGRACAPERTRRETIAVLTDHMDPLTDGYETVLRAALDATCRELDLDLLLVYGRPLAGPPEWCAGYNAVYELMVPDCVDGIVLSSGSLAHYAGPEAVLRLCEGYRSLPLCSAGLALGGVPSIVVENRTGMEAVVEHLIRDHGRRRLAFIGGQPGSPDSKLRFEAYRSVLERHGLKFEPELVTYGDFTKVHSHAAMLDMLGRGIRPDAVVAANDGMAFGAIEALRQHGLRVPRDLPVTGFDDLVMARLGSPPLTTVAQPLEAMARLAVRLVHEQLAGHTVPLCTELPAEVMIRQSCGCHGCNSRRRFSPRPGTPRSPAKLLEQERPRLARLLEDACGTENARAAGDAERLLEALQSEFSGHQDSFRQLLEDLLEAAEDDETRTQNLLLATTHLREEFREVISPELGELWNTAHSMIADAKARGHAQRRVATVDACERALQTGEQCSRSLDLSSLKAALTQGLGVMGIDTAFIARYSEHAPGELEPIVCLLDGRAFEPPAPRFAAHELLPPRAWLDGQRRTWVVFPLAFETQRLGVAVFGYRSSMIAYQMLRDQIASALRSVGLLQEIVDKTTLHERSVQERLATARRMESLSVLAGGVAHDLNNALGPLVTLPDVILRELSETDGERSLAVGELRCDLESMRAASLRAAQTIKDLLTLSRQGRTSKELLDLNQIVANCLATEPVRAMNRTEREVNLTLDLHPEALLVQASEPHLARAVANLVRNAVEAIEGPGAVALRTRSVVVKEPTSGYETIEPGQYAVVSVADTGSGIAPSALGHVFEPFFSQKRIGENSGSGLGLAIVHGVVKEHQGFLDVESTVGRGTTFTLYFPRATEVPRRRAKPSVVPRGRAKILMIDDEPSQLRTGRRVLAHLGYQVETMPSGQQALELFAQAARAQAAPDAARESPYHLVIVDMILNEEQDGLQIYEQMSRLFPAQKVIIASGYAPTERAERAIQNGLTWLVKPYTTDILAHAVRAALADHRE